MTSLIQVNTTVAGVTFSQARSVTSEAVIAQERTIPAAQAGTLTTRTDANTGTVTMTSGGHTVTTGARLDVYWTASGVKKCRRGMTVGTVSGTSVPIDGGSGDDLPSTSTALTVAVPVELATAINGDDLKSLILGAPETQVQFVLCSSGDTEELAKNLTSGEVFYWEAGQLGTVNPIAGDTIVKTFVSHGDSTGSKRVQLVAQYDN